MSCPFLQCNNKPRKLRLSGRLVKKNVLFCVKNVNSLPVAEQHLRGAGNRSHDLCITVRSRAGRKVQNVAFKAGTPEVDLQFFYIHTVPFFCGKQFANALTYATLFMWPTKSVSRFTTLCDAKGAPSKSSLILKKLCGQAISSQNPKPSG